VLQLEGGQVAPRGGSAALGRGRLVAPAAAGGEQQQQGRQQAERAENRHRVTSVQVPRGAGDVDRTIISY
jgi:hypothetical protein